MTPEPCGPFCPFAACESCPFKGGMTPNVCANSAVIWDNWSGKDERPAASTAGRSSHSDSRYRKGGLAPMVANSRTAPHHFSAEISVP